MGRGYQFLRVHILQVIIFMSNMWRTIFKQHQFRLKTVNVVLQQKNLLEPSRASIGDPLYVGNSDSMEHVEVTTGFLLGVPLMLRSFQGLPVLDFEFPTSNSSNYQPALPPATMGKSSMCQVVSWKTQPTFEDTISGRQLAGIQPIWRGSLMSWTA